jgi:hypothetical protein
MIQPGREWQARELAEAADKVYVGGLSKAEINEKTTYSLAVAEVMRLLVGDLDIESASPHLQEIYRRYRDAL